MQVLRRRNKLLIKSRLITITLVMVIFMSSQATGASSLVASWYSVESLKREKTWKNGVERRMANGQRFSDSRFTAATWLFPLGSKLLITNLNNGRSVEVIVCDRIGKRFAKTRIDLSKAAFMAIAPLEQGIVPISIEVLYEPPKKIKSN